MKIVDTYADIIALLNRMDSKFSLDLWESYIMQISPELLDKIKEDSSQYDFDNDILPVIRNAMKERDKLAEAHDSFLFAVKDLSHKIMKATGVELPVVIIFYLGLCNGAGWATKLEGNPTVLLGIEKIVELDWHGADTMTALIFHELGHIWHDAAGGLHREIHSTKDKYLLQLYQEGLAMYFEQLLSADFSRYHQDKNGWLDWCLANQNELNAEYLKRLRDDQSAQDFFGDWHSYQGHSDVGYFIGCEFIKHLAKTYPLKEIAAFPLDAVYKEFAEYAMTISFIESTTP